MFGFDMDNREERKVENTVIGETVIDTCAVNDSDQPFETGIQSPQYNMGDWVVVEMYDTKPLAEEGHKKWVDIFKPKDLPSELKDVSTSAIAKLCRALTSN